MKMMPRTCPTSASNASRNLAGTVGTCRTNRFCCGATFNAVSSNTYRSMLLYRRDAGMGHMGTLLLRRCTQKRLACELRWQIAWSPLLFRFIDWNGQPGQLIYNLTINLLRFLSSTFVHSVLKAPPTQPIFITCTAIIRFSLMCCALVSAVPRHSQTGDCFRWRNVRDHR